jgi:spore maturation protein CgeB
VKIAFFGSSLVSSYWNGAATYYRGLVKELWRRGHAITFFEPDAFERQQHRDLPFPEWAHVIVYAPTVDAALAALEQARGADVVVKCSGVGVHDELLEKAVLDVPACGVSVFWDVDAPATLARLEADDEDPFRDLLPRYDLVLTYGGGARVVERYRALGATDCVPVYNAVDPESHYPVPPEPSFGADLSFLGNRLPDRELRVERFLLRAAELAPRSSFLLAGSGWQDRSVPPNVRVIGHVPATDHNAFNCSPLAVLNVSRESMAANGWSPATRVFECAGAGACLISDAWDGVEDFLEPGREVLLATSGADVAATLDDLTPVVAQRIGAAARRRVLAEHTYERRALQVERVLADVGVTA